MKDIIAKLSFHKDNHDKAFRAFYSHEEIIEGFNVKHDIVHGYSLINDNMVVIDSKKYKIIRTELKSYIDENDYIKHSRNEVLSQANLDIRIYVESVP